MSVVCCQVESVVSVVCCQVDVSVSGRSRVQRSATECGASECEAPIMMRLRSIAGSSDVGENVIRFIVESVKCRAIVGQQIN